jgi:hypothetical protein
MRPPQAATILCAVAIVLLLAMLPAVHVSDAADIDSRSPPQPSNAFAPGSKVSSSEGPCLTFNGLRDAIIENVVIGPCAGNGIELFDSHNVTLRSIAISGTAQSGIYIFESSSISVEESSISGGVSGVYAVSSSGVRVSCNTIENPRGPVPRGQLVQFDKVTGKGNEISCNVGRNAPGQGEPEDAISLYQSQGTPQSPILVSNNLVVGGGPSESGGGIMLGDNGGSNQVAEGNDLVDPGQYGVAVASGERMTIRNNRVYARAQAFTNVGISVWNQYPHACRDIAVEGNAVKWQSKTGRANPYWNGGNCGPVAGIASNNFRAPLDPTTMVERSTACACRNEGRR